MRARDRCLKFVQWEENGQYFGYGRDLFPFGGVCHSSSEEDACRQICAMVAGEVTQLEEAGRELPPSGTRPMRDAVPA